MKFTLQVAFCMTLVAGSWSLQAKEKVTLPDSKTSTLKTPTSTPSAKDTSSDSEDSEETGISHIIKHSKLFTEFVSFAVNPVKSVDMMDSLKTNVLSNYTLPKQGNETLSIQNSTSPSESDQAPSSELLQQLFVEMTKVNSPGFIVSFDYLNVTAKSSNGEDKSRTPVRMWGLLPDHVNNKTVYFLADYFVSTSYDADTKGTAREQIEDFEAWKNETLASLSSDKLGDATIGSLLGR